VGSVFWLPTSRSKGGQENHLAHPTKYYLKMAIEKIKLTIYIENK